MFQLIDDALRLSADDINIVVNDGVVPWKLLIVDDDREVHGVTTLVLRDFCFEGRPIAFLHAYSAAEAALHLENEPDIAVALVDVVMEREHAGLDLVRHVREELGNRFVRIILRTGQPGAAPEREVITRFDVNDYKTKSELSSTKLFSAIMTALRSFRDIIELDARQRGMARLVEASANLMRSGSISDFSKNALDGLRYVMESQQADGYYACMNEPGETTTTVLFSSGLREKFTDMLHARAPEREWDCHEGGVRVRLGGSPYAVHQVGLRLNRNPTIIEGDLLGLFQQGAQTILEKLLVGERIQIAQRSAIRAMAQMRALSGRPGGKAESRASEGNVGDIVPQPAGGSLVSFLRHMAILAETPEWGGEAGAHLVRIERYSTILAQRAGLSDAFCQAIGPAAALHDLGKLFVEPSGSHGWWESVGPRRDRAVEHVQWGGDYISGVNEKNEYVLTMATQIASSHHEAWFGAGYPQKLEGDAIPMAARVVAIVDFYEMCVNFPPNAAEFTHKEACELVSASTGCYFDPALVKVFLMNHDLFFDRGRN